MSAELYVVTHLNPRFETGPAGKSTAAVEKWEIPTADRFPSSVVIDLDEGSHSYSGATRDFTIVVHRKWEILPRESCRRHH